MPVHKEYDVYASVTEWYTPVKCIAAVREVLEAIDLDPASDEIANTVVQAAKYYTKQQHGLYLPWHGRVFLNPPYGKETGKSNQETWTGKLIAEYQKGNVSEAICLTNVDSSTFWYHRLLRFPHCQTLGRLHFWTPVPGEKNRSLSGSIFTYFGHKKEKFFDVFEQFGTCQEAARIPKKPSLFDEIGS